MDLFYAQGRVERVGAWNIWVRDTKGTRKPLLLLHGFPTSSFDWSRMWQSLEAEFRLVAFDMLGFGHSDKPIGHSYTIMEQADIALVIMSRVAIAPETTTILAHDYGDSVAQELMARATFLHVFLLNGGMLPEAHRPLCVQNVVADRTVGQLLCFGLCRPVFGIIMRRLFARVTRAELDDFWKLVSRENGHVNIHSLLGYMQERRRHRNRWIEPLSRPNVSILIGTADPVSGDVWNYRKLNVAEVTCGHYPHWESPDAVISWIQNTVRDDRRLKNVCQKAHRDDPSYAARRETASVESNESP